MTYERFGLRKLRADAGRATMGGWKPLGSEPSCIVDVRMGIGDQMSGSAVQLAIERAVVLLRDSSRGDDEIRQALVAAGVEWSIASRLVEFLPMAYCRALLEPAGAQFPETF